MKKLLMFLFLCCPYSVISQTAPVGGSWILSLQGGPVLHDLSSTLEKQMRSQGYTDPSSWLFGKTPMTRQDPLLQIGLEKAIRRSWSGKLLASAWSGYLNGTSQHGNELKLDYGVFSTALLGGIHTSPRIARIALGPALHFMYLDHTDHFSSYRASVENNKFKLGLIGEAGCRFPTNSRLFFDLSAQYHLIGKQAMGTYEAEGVDIYGQPYSNRFVAGSHSLDHFSLNIGVGVRFGRIVKEPETAK